MCLSLQLLRVDHQPVLAILKKIVQVVLLLVLLMHLQPQVQFVVLQPVYVMWLKRVQEHQQLVRQMGLLP
jgi:hypothetical protein